MFNEKPINTDGLFFLFNCFDLKDKCFRSKTIIT